MQRGVLIRSFIKHEACVEDHLRHCIASLICVKLSLWGRKSLSQNYCDDIKLGIEYLSSSGFRTHFQIRILPARQAIISPTSVMGTGLFNMEKAESAPGSCAALSSLPRHQFAR